MCGLSGCNIFAFLSKNSRAARAHREADRKTISCQCNQLSRFFDIFYIHNNRYQVVSWRVSGTMHLPSWV